MTLQRMYRPASFSTTPWHKARMPRFDGSTEPAFGWTLPNDGQPFVDPRERKACSSPSCRREQETVHDDSRPPDSPATRRDDVRRRCTMGVLVLQGCAPGHITDSITRQRIVRSGSSSTAPP